MTAEAVDVPMEVESSIMTKEEDAEPTNTTVATVSPTADRSVLCSPQMLHLYYSRLFPYSFLYDWLSYGDKSLFSRREFSFTIEDEVILRYRSFNSCDELCQGIIKRSPQKIDIGAVFQAVPKDKHAISSKQNKPQQRELVFDIDLTDYDAVRHCGCNDANICHVCWGYMKMAMKLMDQGLREDFGFEKIAWFYSGRRGVHAWVCDEVARTLSDEGRSAVLKYFDVRWGPCGLFTFVFSVSSAHTLSFALSIV